MREAGVQLTFGCRVRARAAVRAASMTPSQTRPYGSASTCRPPVAKSIGVLKDALLNGERNHPVAVPSGRLRCTVKLNPKSFYTIEVNIESVSCEAT